MAPTLQIIACHLHDNTETFRRIVSSGFPSETNPMIIQHLSGLEQQAFVLTHVVQALLQMIDDRRTSQRMRGAFRWLGEKSNKGKKSKTFKILAAMKALSSLVGAF